MIGVYGGTFDPIHLGHIHLLQELIKSSLFSKIIIVPAKQNPLKPNPANVSSQMRLTLLNAALNELNNPKISIWDGELKRSGVSYMKDTLHELKNIFSEDLALIVGDEVFSEFPKWKEPQTVLSLANLVIVTRNSAPLNVLPTLEHCGISDGLLENEVVRYAQNSRWVKILKINALPYSSTEIRHNLAKAWKTGDLNKVPQGIQRSVWLLIKENQLYAVS